MSDLYNKQQALLRIIERSLDNFKKIGKNNYTPAKVRSRMASLKETWSQCIQTHASLMHTNPEPNRDAIDYFKLKHFELADEVVQTTLDFMAECLEELEPSGSFHQSTPIPPSRIHDAASSLSLSHLPPINIPVFSGNFEEWESFRDRFISLIIHNKDLSAFARMHFLSSSLAGRALDTIKNIPITADNFDIAWRTLVGRYENKRRLIDVHISALLNLPSLSRETALELTDLRDRANRSITSLRNLNRSSDEILSDILVFTISQKLDLATRKAWKLRGGDESDIPTYEDLDRFLASRARVLEELTPAPANKISRSSRFSPLTVATTSTTACILCKASHFLNKCPQFIKKSPSRRLDVVKAANRCINCLSSKHSVQSCPSKYSCRNCQNRHHTMLHVDPVFSPANLASTSHATGHSSTNNTPAVTALTATRSSRSNVLLATARVCVNAPSGRSLIVRALIDQGSEITFMTEKLRQILKLRRIKMPLNVSAVGGIDVEACRYAANICITPIDGSNHALTTIASILKTLSNYVPKQTHFSAPWDHIAGLKLADSKPFTSDPIDLLIGADLYGELILDGVKKGGSGQPVAQNTIFGWIISGPSSPSATSSSRVTVQHCSASLTLDQELRKFWEVEEVPRQMLLDPEEQRCEDHFLSTHSRAPDGRYIVRLPFKQGPPIDIGDSLRSANNCLKGLQRRFKTQPRLKTLYSQFLQEYEVLGHMKKVSDETDNDQQCVYIPHHPVIRDTSSTTPLRVVFNASNASSNSTSLNDHLLAGPKLQTDLAAVILNWRMHKYVLSADITKMYRQILVDPRDVNYQRILWSCDETEQIHRYQLVTVTYGTASAPFLALRVLRQLVLDEGHAFPLAVPILRENIYVDDLLFGADDIPLLKQIRDQVRSLLCLGHFELRKWSSNSSTLLNDIDASAHGLACHKNLQSDEQLKILGISWNPCRDVFQFRVTPSLPMNMTKRSILSTTAKIFDPLGWGTPVTVTAKILLQQLWKSSLGWDDPLSSSLATKWAGIHASLTALDGLSINRWVGQGSDILNIELHGFADASCAAYAAAVYLRVVSCTRDVTTSLLIGKSKVAPVKSWSIPRLELAAVVLLTRLIDFVRSSLHMTAVSCFCWTDSTIVLAWLSQHPSKWKTFVANRVSDVHSRLPTAIWRHVPTKENPADCASRGLLGHELATHNLWWHGPQWLHLDASEWPIQPDKGDTSVEENPRAVAHLSTALEPWDLATRYSSLPKLIRVTAYILRFTSQLRQKKEDEAPVDITSRTPTSEECKRAREVWYRRIQSEVFHEEKTALLHQRSLPAKSPLLSLHPFLDELKIIRVGGRLQNSQLPFNTRHPIILAAHPVAALLIRNAHLRSLHAGPQLTLATVRQEFWILRARRLVRTIINQCVVCAREKAAITTQLMGNLPPVRVNPPARAFLHCGVDYAGPVLVRPLGGRGVVSHKAYIAIFVCMASRAVHLELVDGYSTAAFLAAYSRFCARRGLPESMYSDNGTTFVGADREMTLAFRAALRDPNFQSRTACDRVSWHFIPPSSPHFGGLWEAGVRSVKHHLRRVLGSHTLTFEEFTTLLCNVEACLNSRPLAPLTDNPEDYETLTPGHFLIGSALTAIPEPSILQLQENRLSRWQLIRQLFERFWKLWTDDYLNTLQQRNKWRLIKNNPVKIGQLVLLRNSVLPPCKWELGRIIKSHDGPDGLVRVVTVKTAHSEYVRPIAKLCFLPVSLEQADATS